MKLVYVILTVVAYAGLCLVIIPAILVFASVLDTGTSKQLMAAGTFLWFAAFGFKEFGGKKE